MQFNQPVPGWLWRTATWSFGSALIGIIALALALAAGFADPPRAGPLWLDEDFKAGVDQWQFVATGGSAFGPHAGALVAEFTAPDQFAFGVIAPPPSTDFSMEVAGTADRTAGEAGAAYGLVFDWHDEAHYSAVLVNDNGYAEVYRQAGAEQTNWFVWQQWPPVTGETNRVRIDVHGTQVAVRINDERLIEVTAATAGKIGVMASSPGQSRVVFSWVKVWAAH